MNPLAEFFKEKICARCNQLFIPTSGTQIYCFSCKEIHVKEYKSQWGRKNKDRLKERSKKWYWDNLERAREIKRKWNMTHKEKHNSYPRKYIEPSPQRIKEITGRTQAKRNARRAGMQKVCFDCSTMEGRIELHHLDKNTSNNELINLRYVCKYHHTLYHRKPLSFK